ncbi:DUF5615 family PIN-like protein [Parvibaculum sp.]|uniref:DUF5615 family PIN-like protein n=1 Tax=Parvibaculum sp. TaxID=2024848 RepID=UPI0025FDCDFB|nr:DUF5615 family PIN-like protein [Parvibaculum sp.]
MKIRGDEHLSPYIVKAIRDLALSPGFEISSVHELGQQGASDVHWITSFAREGGHAILSADSDFLTLAPQVNAVFDTGLRVIHMPHKWVNAKGHLQAAFILQWWKRIEDAVKTMKSRECLRPEWNITESGQLKKVPINFQKAQRARRKGKA